MNVEIRRTDQFVENDICVGSEKIGIVELSPQTKEITRLYIYEPYQNKGYGTAVVKQLVEKGYRKLWVRSDNLRAIHVYEKCGFKKKGDVMFEMRTEVEELIEKELEK